MLKSHNEGTWFTCKVCQKKFTSSTVLKQHLRRHRGDKPYICSDCPKCFCTLSELKSHQFVHSEVKAFCCSLCDKSFSCKERVKQHFKRCFDKLGLDDVIFPFWVKDDEIFSSHCREFLQSGSVRILTVCQHFVWFSSDSMQEYCLFWFALVSVCCAYLCVFVL